MDNLQEKLEFYKEKNESQLELISVLKNQICLLELSLKNMTKDKDKLEEENGTLKEDLEKLYEIVENYRNVTSQNEQKIKHYIKKVEMEEAHLVKELELKDIQIAKLNETIESLIKVGF